MRESIKSRSERVKRSVDSWESEWYGSLKNIRPMLGALPVILKPNFGPPKRALKK